MTIDSATNDLCRSADPLDVGVCTPVIFSLVRLTQFASLRCLQQLHDPLLLFIFGALFFLLSSMVLCFCSYLVRSVSTSDSPAISFSGRGKKQLHSSPVMEQHSRSFWSSLASVLQASASVSCSAVFFFVFITTSLIESFSCNDVMAEATENLVAILQFFENLQLFLQRRRESELVLAGLSSSSPAIGLQRHTSLLDLGGIVIAGEDALQLVEEGDCLRRRSQRRTPYRETVEERRSFSHCWSR